MKDIFLVFNHFKRSYEAISLQLLFGFIREVCKKKFNKEYGCRDERWEGSAY